MYTGKADKNAVYKTHFDTGLLRALHSRNPKNIRNPLIFFQKMATYSCFLRVPRSKIRLQASLRRISDLLTLVSYKFFNRECKKGRSLFFLSVVSAAVLSIGAGLTGCGRAGDPVLEQEEPKNYDLTVFTAQEPEEWGPVIKEFEERTGWNVKVETGSARELLSQLEKEEADWDVAFGVSVDALEEGKDYWQENKDAWTGYSDISFVILYNTNVVTYRELPTGWDSLLEPRWKGRVAVPDPFKSDLAAAVLTEAAENSGKEDFLDLLGENMQYQMPETFKEAEQGISDGRYSIGVTSEEAAKALLAAGQDVDYIDPEEGKCLFEDGTAIRKGSQNIDAAEEFVTYTTCDDTKWLLHTQLLRQPAEDTDQKAAVSEEELTQRFSRQQEVLSIWKIIMDEKGSAAHEREQ